MKKLVLLMSVSLFFSNAYARHAYRSEICKSTTHIFTYDGNYPVGGYYSISKVEDKDRDNRVILVEKDSEEYSEDERKEMANFEIKKVRKSWFNRSKDDGCFETNIYRNVKTLKFTNLKPEELKNAGLNEGQEIKFSCVEEYNVPSGDNC